MPLNEDVTLARYASHAHKSLCVAMEYADVLSEKPSMYQEWHTEFLAVMESKGGWFIDCRYSHEVEGESELLEGMVNDLISMPPINILFNQPFEIIKKETKGGITECWLQSRLAQKTTGSFQFYVNALFSKKKTRNWSSWLPFKKKAEYMTKHCSYSFVMHPFGDINEPSRVEKDMSDEYYRLMWMKYTPQLWYL